MHDDEWFSLEELTQRLGALAWVESQLGDVLVGWSRIEEHAQSAVVFAATGEHHRWHGEVVRECLPTSPALDAESHVRAPTPGWQHAIEVFASLSDPESTSVRLKALVAIVDPWLDREITALLELARPVSDAAMQRWLRFVALDHGDDGQTIAQLHAARSHEAARMEDHALLSGIDLTASSPSAADPSDVH